MVTAQPGAPHGDVHRDGQVDRPAVPPVAGRRATVCVVHGGRAPQVKAAARERLAVEAANRLAIPVETTAAAALQDGLARLNGEVLWLEEQVSKLPPEDLTWGIVERRTTFQGGPDGSAGSPLIMARHAERRHPLWVALNDATTRRSAIATEMARLGIEARQVRVMELVGAKLADGLERALTDAGVPLTVRARVLQLLPGAIGSGE